MKIIIILFFLFGCSAPTKKTIITSDHRKILLFVPGYYGSTLVGKNSGELRWARASHFLFDHRGIAMTVPGTSITADEDLIPKDVLKEVALIPGLIKTDSYGRTLAQLSEFAELHQMTIETVAYDWRDDFISSIRLIDLKIKSLNLKSNDELFVVSHSTGALLMAYYIRYGAQDFEVAQENWDGLKYITKAVLAAAPLHGLMVLMNDMEHGTTKGLNHNLMSARDYSTFKSSYFFLPPNGEDLAFNVEEKSAMPMKLHDPETWEKNQWSLFKFIKEPEFGAAKTFISTYMNRSQKFHELLRAPVKQLPTKKIPLLYTWGSGHKTLQVGFVSKDKEGSSKKNIDFSSSESRVDGDGTVTLESGRPLDYFSNLTLTLHSTQLGHLEVISDEDNQKFIQDFLLKE